MMAVDANCAATCMHHQVCLLWSQCNLLNRQCLLGNVACGEHSDLSKQFHSFITYRLPQVY